MGFEASNLREGVRAVAAHSAGCQQPRDENEGGHQDEDGVGQCIGESQELDVQADQRTTPKSRMAEARLKGIISRFVAASGLRRR